MKSSKCVPVMLGWLLGLAAMAGAHSVQEEPSQVRIVPRRDYLTVHITGAAVDWHDTASTNPHHNSAPSGQPLEEDAAAARYAETHLILEQGGQVLPLTLHRLQWRKLRGDDPSSERFEIFLRAARPEKVADAPLNVASDLFSNLEKSSTLVQLGDQSKELRGTQTAEFPAILTRPTPAGDLQNFASSGAATPLQDVVRLILLATLLLGLSLLSLRQMLIAMAALLLGQCLAFFLGLFGFVAMSAPISHLGVALSIALLAGAGWFQASRGEESNSPYLTGTAFLGGLASGSSGVASLRDWGLPESGLLWCGLAFLVGAAFSQGVVTLVVWPVLSHWKRKFNHQAQYGGMNWPRVVQIASLACGAVGGFYSLL